MNLNRRFVIKTVMYVTSIIVLAFLAYMVWFGIDGASPVDSASNYHEAQTAHSSPLNNNMQTNNSIYDELDLIYRDISLMPEGIRDFPIFHLYSELDPFTQERQFWHRGSLAVTDTNAPFLMENTPVQIRGRGNSTWAHGSEKRPLRLRFDEPLTLLDSGHDARDWVLIANLFDMSLVRTHAAFKMASGLDTIYWTPFSRLVHLYINGKYQGVYQLADERDIGPGRAQLTFDPNPAISEYLIEMQMMAPAPDTFRVGERGYIVQFPRTRDLNGHTEYARDFFQAAEDAVLNHDFELMSTLIDLPSMIDYYLVQEFFKNIDVGERSNFFQIRGQGESRRIYFGPIWDFDRSAGNTRYWTAPSGIHAASRNIWFREMMQIPEIQVMVAARWNEIVDTVVRDMINYLTHLFYYYIDAFELNFERHDHIFGGNPSWFFMVPYAKQEIHDFRGQADYLLNWFEERILWLGDFLNEV